MNGCPALQRGVAVITVLLALAIAVLVSSEVISRVFTGMKRSQIQFSTQQAWQYALGGEAWARQQLAADFEKDKQRKVDHLFEDWATPAQTLPVDGGFIEIEIADAQARFNLNNLVDDKGQVITEQVVMLKRLLSFVGARASYADLAAQWASYADDTGGLYGTDEFPYHAADTQFGSVSEMRLLRDIELKEYRRMAPFLAALPEPVKVNINTAPEEVLAALLPGNVEQTQDRLRAFLQKRESIPEGFTSGDAFITAMGIQTDELQAEDLAASSEYFEVRVRTEYNGRRAYLVSLLYRDAETGEISLVARDSSRRFSFLNSSVDKDSKEGEPGEEEQAVDEGDGKEKGKGKRSRKAGEQEKTGE